VRVDLKDVVQLVRSRWSMLVGGLVIGLVVAWALTSLATPQYSSSSRLFVSAAATDPAAAYSANLFTQERMTSYGQLVTDDAVAERVVHDLQLDMTPSQLVKRVSVRVVPNTVILAVTVSDTSPRRAQAIAETLDQRFIGRVELLETAPGSTASPIRITVLTPPQLNTDPVSPNRARNLVLGGVVGLLAGLVLALVRYRLDDTVKSGQDVSGVTGAGLIGSVVHDPGLTRKAGMRLADDGSAAAEALRAIRTQLQWSDAEGLPRSIVVTSPLDGQGTTTLAVNLAVVLGQAGHRVLLVEADLRRPRLADQLGLIGDTGLVTVLAGNATWSDAAQPWQEGVITVLPAGSAPARPSELLGSARMRALLDELGQAFDVVLIDTPPLLAVTDAAVVSAAAEGCLLVARYGKTHREELAEAALALERVGARLLGVVLNDVPRGTRPRLGRSLAPAHVVDAGARSGRAARTPGGGAPAFTPVVDPQSRVGGA
jgi:receptor protein-tyrosine kinase